MIRARETGEGSYIDVAQSDAAAAMDWYRSESWRAYERPESEVTGNKADNYERRAPGTAGMVEGVRYQVYETTDGAHVLFMASEQAFWKNFCEAVERTDLFERWPGSKYADHARGNRELQGELRDIFLTKTAEEWLEFGGRVNTPIAPVNTPKTLLDDPQFADRFPLLPAAEVGHDQIFTPLHFVGEELPAPGQGADRRTAHRGRLALGARLRRRSDRHRPGRGRIRNRHVGGGDPAAGRPPLRDRDGESSGRGGR